LNLEEDVATLRASLYQMLSIAFYPPKPEVLKFWSEVLSNFLEEGPSGKDTASIDPLELRVEYNRLFVGPGRLPCPPYESVYRKDRAADEMGTLMGPSALDVKSRYAEAGLEISKSFKDYPDHVAVELEFMNFLCSKEAATTDDVEKEDLRRKQREFLEKHIRKWAGEFSDRVLKNTNSLFYKTAASFLKEHVDDELELFSESSE